MAPDRQVHLAEGLRGERTWLLWTTIKHAAFARLARCASRAASRRGEHTICVACAYLA